MEILIIKSLLYLYNLLRVKRFSFPSFNASANRLLRRIYIDTKTSLFFRNMLDDIYQASTVIYYTNITPDDNYIEIGIIIIYYIHIPNRCQGTIGRSYIIILGSGYRQPRAELTLTPLPLHQLGDQLFVLQICHRIA